ncbi:damage-inducible protein YebG [Oceanisphaera profunda]|uniref:Damage-inducible protein YebG n=1 Tax=Oceanisphaera profunda TaxID=1416627 RepID=A0A1Y0D964_9GAMM|nr:YebG family protein [Oceanisphaera profunda]ART83824.1 damage-inducible protein YebG [Oceanisphaera profunda]
MAVTIQYLVVRNGIEKMTFTNKKEADAYDRLLDLAEHLDEVLERAPISLNETDREALALFLAENQDLLSGPKKQPAKKAAKPASKAADAELTTDDVADEPADQIHAVA